jgi:hypothetical protein
MTIKCPPEADELPSLEAEDADIRIYTKIHHPSTSLNNTSRLRQHKLGHTAAQDALGV